MTAPTPIEPEVVRDAVMLSGGPGAEDTPINQALDYALQLCDAAIHLREPAERTELDGNYPRVTEAVLRVFGGE